MPQKAPKIEVRRRLFEPFGELSAVILNCDEETKKHRGVGFVVTLGSVDMCQLHGTGGEALSSRANDRL